MLRKELQESIVEHFRLPINSDLYPVYNPDYYTEEYAEKMCNILNRIPGVQTLKTRPRLIISLLVDNKKLTKIISKQFSKAGWNVTCDPAQCDIISQTTGSRETKFFMEIKPADPDADSPALSEMQEMALLNLRDALIDKYRIDIFWDPVEDLLKMSGY